MPPPPPPLLPLLLLICSARTAPSGPTVRQGDQPVDCDEFLQMKVLDEVRAIAQGRVPRECRDRKLEQQRRDQRHRAAAQRGSSAGPSGRQYAAAVAKMRPLRQLLQTWPLGQLQRPSEYQLPIPSFDFHTEAQAAERLRDADMPFVVRNVPDVSRTAVEWSRDPDKELGYLFGDKKFGVTSSSSESFLYYDVKSSTPTWIEEHNWVPPTDTVEMNYTEWRRANLEYTDGRYYYGMATVPNTYSRARSEKGPGEQQVRFGFLADALQSMTKDAAPPLLEPRPNKMNWHGLDCRLGHAAILSEAHYDFKRNFIAMLVGEKRYILLPPTACIDLSLLPYGHPSARHSNVTLAQVAACAAEGSSNQSVARDLTDNSQIDPEHEHDLPQADTGCAHVDRFLGAQALDVHLLPGDVLHLPAYWFHAVLSLSQSVQCNSFVGAPSTTAAQDHVENCMMQISGEGLSHPPPKPSQDSGARLRPSNDEL